MDISSILPEAVKNRMERRLAEHSRRLKNLLRICPITVILVGHH
jgi:hypothetical protein